MVEGFIGFYFLCYSIYFHNCLDEEKTQKIFRLKKIFE